MRRSSSGSGESRIERGRRIKSELVVNRESSIRLHFLPLSPKFDCFEKTGGKKPTCAVKTQKRRGCCICTDRDGKRTICIDRARCTYIQGDSKRRQQLEIRVQKRTSRATQRYLTHLIGLCLTIVCFLLVGEKLLFESPCSRHLSATTRSMRAILSVPFNERFFAQMNLTQEPPMLLFCRWYATGFNS